MIRWLMALWRQIQGDRATSSLASTSASADSLSQADIARIANAVMQSLLQTYGVMAVYCPDFESNADAQAAARDLPLFYVWGQREQESGTAFHFSTNGFLISLQLMQHLAPGSTRFRLLRDKIQRTLHKVAYDALLSECRALELTPRDLLDVWTMPGEGAGGGPATSTEQDTA